MVRLMCWFLPSMALLAATPPPAAKAAFERGEKALAANQLDAAADAYKEALAASPGYAAASNGLGSVLFRQGDKAEAIAQFQAAIQSDPRFKLAYFNLGYASRKSNDFTTAVVAYEKYTQLEPTDPDGFYGLAESYRQTRQVPKAIGAYETYLAREKRSSEQKWVDRAKEQIALLERASGEAPSFVSPPSDAGLPTAEEGPPTLPAGIVPSTALAARKVADGDRLMQEKRYRDASFAFQDAANADPLHVEALFKLGNAYAILGYYTQAIERWSSVARLSADPAIKKSAQDNITKAQSKIVQAGGGSPQAQGRAFAAGPVTDTAREQARAAYEQGVKRINARDYGAALTQLSTALQLEPALAIAYVARGSAQIGLRRFSEAAVDYQFAFKLDGTLASPLYGLAEAYRAMGRTAEARAYYERYATSAAADVRPELQAEARQKAERLR